jgi:hypothetical protein
MAATATAIRHRTNRQTFARSELSSPEWKFALPSAVRLPGDDRASALGAFVDLSGKAFEVIPIRRVS